MLCMCYVFCYVSLRKQPTLRDVTTGFPGKRRLRDDRRVLLIGLAAWEIWLYQSEAPPDLGSDASSVWNFCAQTSFRGETSQLASRNVGCFLRLLLCMCANLGIFYNENVPPSLLPQCHVTPLPPRWPLSLLSLLACLTSSLNSPSVCPCPSCSRGHFPGAPWSFH